MKKVENFPAKPWDEIDDKEIMALVLQFMSNFFEKIPEKFALFYQGRSPE